MILSAFIVNKAGGLMYHADFGPAKKLSSNELLVFAGTFHGYSGFLWLYDWALCFQVCTRSPQRFHQKLDRQESSFWRLTHLIYIAFSR